MESVLKKKSLHSDFVLCICNGEKENVFIFNSHYPTHRVRLCPTLHGI